MSVLLVGPRGERREFHTLQKDLPLLPSDTESPWVVVWPDVRVAFNKMLLRTDRRRRRDFLGETPGHQAQMGVKTGLNAVYVIKRVEVTERAEEVVVYAEGYSNPRTPEGRRKEYVARVEKDMLLPLMRGGDVEAWQCKARDYILWTHDCETGKAMEQLPPKAVLYFQRHSAALTKRDDYRGGMPIWEIFRVSRDKLGDKVTWQRISSSLGCVYAPSGVRAEDGTSEQIIPLDTAYILSVSGREQGYLVSGWLNSVASQAYTSSYARRDRGAYHHYDAWVIGLVPVPEGVAAAFATENGGPDVERIVRISGKLHENPSRPDRARLQDELDNSVAELYGLSKGELEAVRSYFAFVRADGVGIPPMDEDDTEEE